jgi:small conductance mechanosensitive channel
MNIALALGILGYFGVQTTSFAALLAGAGVAIGAAWSGLLGNFAAGAFLLSLRPFKVGDFIVGGRRHGHRAASSACSARRSSRPTT